MRDFYELTETGRGRRLRRIAERALEHYDLEPVRLRLIAQDSNATFRVDTRSGETWALRVGIGGPIAHSEAETQAEMEWLEAIADDTDLTVPVPMRTSSGELTVLVESEGVPEPRICVVFGWLPGPLLADRLTPDAIGKLGAFAARLHAHGARFQPSPQFPVPRYDRVFPFGEPEVLFSAEHSDLLPRSRRTVYEAAREAVERSIQELSGREPMRLLHGDLHMWNVKIMRGRIAGFDFEDLMWGWPVQDIATTLYYWWGEPDFDARWEAFRAGYETVTPWPDADGQIATFIAGRTLVLANTVLVQPEWRSEAAGLIERGERRIQDMLERTAP